MDSLLYNDIIRFIRQYKGTSRYCLKTLKAMYPNVSPFTLGSICSFHCQYKMMANHSRIKNRIDVLYERFQQAVAEGQSPGIIIRLAVDIDVCSGLLARSILEYHYIEKDCPDSGKKIPNKTFISQMLKDTTLIKDRDLAIEIYLSTIHDDQYGPVSDTIKNCIGNEYEELLKKKLQELGLAFRDEKNLRARGYDKTPDIKLETPIAVNGFIVNWIESKALFADQKIHNMNLRNQFLSYWNRFGPGLVIYWFGCIDTVLNQVDKRFIVRESFPENITFLNPSLIKAPTLIC
ncbi:CDAN1-interacting nuclease 1 isoform X2 [Lycorma delicatula]|uniref:CDAN1-interacting nuclease 1 isoform X2 n=1 Tax=Lycorma delicatula TaxID=130591 RepID=UPI003F519536